MNALITLKNLNFFERIKARLNIFKKKEEVYNNKTVYIYEVPCLTKKNIKGLIKTLKKDNIKKVAFENTIERKWEEFLKDDFHIISTKKVYIKNLYKIIIKAMGTLGIRKGKLKLGFCLKKDDIDFYNVLKRLKRNLNLVYIYTKKEDMLSFSDKFYKETGIPVIVKEEVGENEADILIYSNGNIKENEDGKFIFDISLSLKEDIKCVNEIKLSLPAGTDKYNLSDAVKSELFDAGFTIKSFSYKKPLDTHL